MGNTDWPDAVPRKSFERFEPIESISSWFSVYAVADNTYCLLEANHAEEVISYLVVGTERAALIDTGFGIADIRREVESLTGLPVVVVNTHCHFDHVGDNYRFSDVWAYDDDEEIACIERGHSREQCAEYMSPDAMIDLPEGFDLASYAVRPSKVTRRLRHLDTIELGGRTLPVHHTPGHSPGSICLLESPNGILFSGDTIYPGTLFAHLDDADFNDYLESLRYLEGFSGRVSRLCPAHNEAYMPKEALTDALEAFERIASGSAEHEAQGDTRLYRFEGFRVRLPK